MAAGWWKLSGLALLCACNAQPTPKAGPPLEALPGLLARIPVVATENTSNDDITKDEDDLARQLQAYQQTAIPYLMPLLSSAEHRIRRFTGYVLRDIHGFTERDLDALIAARQSGDRWIAPAIASVGSPRAIQFLVDDLRKLPERQTQTTWALQLLGSRAAVPLAHLLDAPLPVDPNLVLATCQIFGDMKDNAAAALDPLVARARSTEPPRANRIAAVREIGCIGPAARSAVQALEEVAAADPNEFGDPVDQAIIAMRVPESGRRLAAQLRQKPSIELLFAIGATGLNARDAGPDVTRLFASDDPDMRVRAAEAIGLIGYDQELTPLANLLADEDDWQVVYAAAQSLGRLHATNALPALDRLTTNHWYLGVRQAARQAAAVIRGSERYLSASYGIDHVKGLPHAANVRLPPAPTRLKFMQGYLVASDQGEFFGDLHYIYGNSPPQTVLGENVKGLHALGDAVVVVTGLQHLSFNKGALYRVTPTSDEEFSVKRWKRLPGAPITSGMLPDGRLFIACIGGDIIVAADGTISEKTGNWP